MKIGLFLDVDKTLTCNLIQKEFATILECEPEFDPIENAFERTKNSEAFGTALVKLFALKNFKDIRAADEFSSIALQPHAGALLDMEKRENIDVFLVSNGPSYYVERLAAQAGIPLDHVICSKYHFNNRTQIIEGCDPVSVNAKANFVDRFRRNYELTVGIGDSFEIDGPFISHCTIPLLTVRGREDFIYIESLSAAALLIDKLQDLGLARAQSATLADVKRIDVEGSTLIELLRFLTVKSIVYLVGGAIGLFLAGVAAGHLLGPVIPTAAK